MNYTCILDILESNEYYVFIENIVNFVINETSDKDGQSDEYLKYFFYINSLKEILKNFTSKNQNILKINNLIITNKNNIEQ